MSMRAVSIAGVGCTAFGAHAHTPIHELAVRAARAAIDESGIARADIGAVYLGNFIGGMLTGQEVLAGLVADAMGLANVPCTKVEGACASGGIAFRHACLMVASGQCDAALAVGVEKMTHASTAQVTTALNAAMDQMADARSGLTYPGLYAMAWRAHAARYGTRREQVSAVVIKNKRMGLANPLAQMGAALDAAAVANSKPIADPVLLFDCCAPGDGAAAAVVVARDRAGAGRAAPIDVRASVQTRGAARLAGHADITSFEATVSAAREAYRQAGIGPRDLDFVELHDCFSIAEILDAEDLGLMPRGHGGGWSLEGRTDIGGDLPINASGGLLAKGHPVGATGLGQIYEAVAQLRGMHPNQVRNAAIGLTHNLGGTGIACTVNILARADG